MPKNEKSLYGVEWQVMKILIYFIGFLHFVDSLSKEKCLKPSSTVKHALMCPETEEEWKRSSVTMNCSQYAPRCPGYDEKKWEYHCVLDTFLTELLEVCAPAVNIIGGNCAEFNIKGDIIQENTNAPCSTAKEKCPFSYSSTDAYKFAGCFSLPKIKVKPPIRNYPTTFEQSTSLDKQYVQLII
ncbi:uncharacterized protein LOC134281914 [Saccostrea cucullata]|uniref:uncharacterized protein LOC134281914 n=1 Tax=Saccostrea cuccullata TaxID=36930 RepID=UPI002ED6BFDE